MHPTAEAELASVGLALPPAPCPASPSSSQLIMWKAYTSWRRHAKADSADAEEVGSIIFFLGLVTVGFPFVAGAAFAFLCLRRRRRMARGGRFGPTDTKHSRVAEAAAMLPIRTEAVAAAAAEAPPAEGAAVAVAGSLAEGASGATEAAPAATPARPKA